jgi:hypothetical protein
LSDWLKLPAFRSSNARQRSDMTDRLRVGVIGGGLIAQVEHIPNLLSLGELFELKGVSDPSATVRNGLTARFGVPVVADAAQLLGLGLDAVVIAAPDPWHGSLTRQAMDEGLHVFCEKPLCYGLEEIDDLAAAQQRNEVILQVGYMKRFDPSFEAALELVRGKQRQLRLVTVEVNDPDAWPFVSHHSLVSDKKALGALAVETDRLRQSQVEVALGFEPSDAVFAGFVRAYCSALVHDVNLVHGLLASARMESGPVLGAALFANGAGGHGAVDLGRGQALWTMSYAEIPNVADYAERIAFYFEDEIVELTFPAPYLNHHPTQLLHKRSVGGRLETTVIRPSYEEAFVRELGHFWASIVRGDPARNTVVDARKDQNLLIELARKAQTQPTA